MTCDVRLPPLPPPIPRPTTIRSTPCKHCPSAKHPPDPEAQDIKDSWPRDQQIESCFPCGWGPYNGPLCKGYCDFLGVTEAEVRAHRERYPEGML